MRLINKTLHPTARLLLAVLLFGLFASGLPAAHYTTLEGKNADGPHAVLVVPLPPYAQSIGIAKQIATLPIERGRLTIAELDHKEDVGEVAKVLAAIAASGDNRPDWLWVHNGPVSASKTETVIRIAADGGDGIVEALGGLWSAETTIVRELPDRLSTLASQGVVTIEYPSNSRVSRQRRHTRQLAVALLRQAGMVSVDTDFEWERLAMYSDQLIALYDAEGIGGAGPRNLERIANAKIDKSAIYRVCGEDIREGALGPAATSIFPGGTGSGTARALESDGRERVREFITGGGGYLGVCAGAYLAASGRDIYLNTVNLKHSQPWPRGRGLLEIELTQEGKKLFGDEKPVLQTRYANGPIFLAEDQEGDGDPAFTVLARFKTPSTDKNGIVREEMVGEAAVGSRAYGDGRVLIISPHPESHAEHYDFVARALTWTMGLD